MTLVCAKLTKTSQHGSHGGTQLHHSRYMRLGLFTLLPLRATGSRDQTGSGAQAKIPQIPPPAIHFLQLRMVPQPPWIMPLAGEPSVQTPCGTIGSGWVAFHPQTLAKDSSEEVTSKHPNQTLKSKKNPAMQKEKEEQSKQKE